MSRFKRVTVTAVLLLSLCLVLAGAAFGLGYLFYEVRDNYFQTGSIDVEIAWEDPQPGQISLFTSGILYEPGMTVRGDFTVTNRSTDENGIWCRFYFAQLTGSLADVMEASIYDGDSLICSGPLRDWQNRRFMEQAVALPSQGSKTLTLELHYPEDAGNDTQAGQLQFSLAVVAVQRSNNP